MWKVCSSVAQSVVIKGKSGCGGASVCAVGLSVCCKAYLRNGVILCIWGYASV